MNHEVSESHPSLGAESNHPAPASRFLRRAAALLAVFLPCAFLAAHAQNSSVDPGLTAHEWGTFTSVAGETGEAVEWLPLNRPEELPSFVEHFRGSGFKLGVSGKLRMETPVLYFYATHDTTVDVGVSFLHGLITECYPSATHIEPSPSVQNAALFQSQSSGSIAWNSVAIEPAAAHDFPRENSGSRYYAARATSASPLRISTKRGSQREQFLFYRGVSQEPPPLSALVLPNGQIEASNVGDSEIPFLLLFERRGHEAGFRQFSSLRQEALFDPPVLDGSVEAARALLESALVSAGLYPDEARAMLETWQDSWFEEGSRLIYIVPAGYLAKVLPLSVTPQPAGVQRVFVGRMELLTPATQSAIETAVARHDQATLDQYGRFVAPFIEILLRKQPHSMQSAALGRTLSKIYDTYIAENRIP